MERRRKEGKERKGEGKEGEIKRRESKRDRMGWYIRKEEESM